MIRNRYNPDREFVWSTRSASWHRLSCMNDNRTYRLLLLATVLAIAILSCDIATACPNCKDGLAGNPNLVRGFFWSILFMMSMPFLIFGSLAGYLYWEVRRTRSADQGSTTSEYHQSDPIAVCSNQQFSSE